MTAKVEKIPTEKPPMDLDTKSQLPEPKGWKILVVMPQAKEKTDGALLKQLKREIWKKLQTYADML